MLIPREALAIRQATDRLADIFDAPDLAERAEFGVRTDDGIQWDAVLSIRGHTFVLEWRRSGSLGHVADTIRQLGSVQASFPREVVPLLAVPYMGEAGQERCVQAGLPWLDLSGNARIIVPGIFHQNLGHPNRFRRPGRPESAFGPKGSRLARHLLMEPSGSVRQRGIAARAGLDEGHVSRVVGKLLEAGLVKRNSDGIRAADPGALLDAWREEYRFDRHDVIRGHISVGGGESLTRFLAEVLSRAGVPYAATALAAAWLWTRHAGFRLSTLYLPSPPSEALRRDLRFREEPRGANTWLVVPNDQGVLDGAESVDDVRCVHPVQAYLDLKDHPERSTEAAAVIRQMILRDSRAL